MLRVGDKTWFYAIRTAALIEAAKGTLVLALGVGLASGLRRNAQHLLGRWAAHVDPLAHLSHVLARVGDLLNKVNAPVVLAVAALYACARYVEALRAMACTSLGTVARRIERSNLRAV